MRPNRMRFHLIPFRSGQPRRAASILATSIFFMSIIASNARLASAPPAAIASVSTRGVICQLMPHWSLHQPHALLPAVADDGVPVAVGLVLVVGGDLEREGFGMLERGPPLRPIQGMRRRQFHHQHVALLAGGSRWGHGGSRRPRCRERSRRRSGPRPGVLVVPDADRVLRDLFFAIACPSALKPNPGPLS